MYIVKRARDNIVFIYSSTAPVFAGGVLSEPHIVLDITANEYVIERVPPLQKYRFFPKALRYTASGWSIADTDLYDHLLELSRPVVLVPKTLTARQARLALHGIGKLADVPAAIAALPEPQKTQAEIEWEYATHIERNNPFVAVLANALQLTDEQIDQLFVDGATL